MLFHAFDCLSLPLLRCTELHCTFPFHHVLFHFHTIPFLNCTVLGYSMYFCAMPSLCPASSSTTLPCHFIAVQSTLLISVPYYAVPLRINALLLFAVPMPYNAIRYLSRCFSVLDLEFNYR